MIDDLAPEFAFAANVKLYQGDSGCSCRTALLGRPDGPEGPSYKKNPSSGRIPMLSLLGGYPRGKKIDAPSCDAPSIFRRTIRHAAGRGMPTSQQASVIQFLRAVRPVVGPTDGELLGRFVVHRDGPAFAESVRRHGS